MKALLALVLLVPVFAQQPEIRRGGPYTVQPRQVMELTVPIPVKNDFVRQVVAYKVTLRYFDGTARFETQHKLAFAPKCDPTGAVEDTWVRFEVPLGFKDEKVTIQRLIVDSTETLP